VSTAPERTASSRPSTRRVPSDASSTKTSRVAVSVSSSSVSTGMRMATASMLPSPLTSGGSTTRSVSGSSVRTTRTVAPAAMGPPRRTITTGGAPVPLPSPSRTEVGSMGPASLSTRPSAPAPSGALSGPSMPPPSPPGPPPRYLSASMMQVQPPLVTSHVPKNIHSQARTPRDGAAGRAPGKVTAGRNRGTGAQARPARPPGWGAMPHAREAAPRAPRRGAPRPPSRDRDTCSPS
jgi:hypothetical protein